MSKTYNIEIVYCDGNYAILDFTITRPIISLESLPERASCFARGYKWGIEIDSKWEYQPKIISTKYKGNLAEYIKIRKKYYEELWDKEDKDE